MREIQVVSGVLVLLLVSRAHSLYVEFQEVGCLTGIFDLFASFVSQKSLILFHLSHKHLELCFIFVSQRFSILLRLCLANIFDFLLSF